MEHGLVGALTGAASSAQKLKHLDPLKWIVRLVVFAGIILIAKKAGVEFTWGNSAIVMLLGFAALMGFGGAFISLLISKPMAKWTTGVQIIDGSPCRVPLLCERGDLLT